MRYNKKKFAEKRGIKRVRRGEKKRKERETYEYKGKEREKAISDVLPIIIPLYFENNT